MKRFNLKKMRGKISQSMLAVHSGVSRDKISRIECGYYKPTAKEICMLKKGIKRCFSRR